MKIWRHQSQTEQRKINLHQPRWLRVKLQNTHTHTHTHTHTIFKNLSAAEGRSERGKEKPEGKEEKQWERKTDYAKDDN